MGELTWEQREHVLRLLFSKMNNNSKPLESSWSYLLYYVIITIISIILCHDDLCHDDHIYYIMSSWSYLLYYVIMIISIILSIILCHHHNHIYYNLCHCHNIYYVKWLLYYCVWCNVVYWSWVMVITVLMILCIHDNYCNVVMVITILISHIQGYGPAKLPAHVHTTHWLKDHRLTTVDCCIKIF